ncbi:MAG TPA: M23 family metallopeptidase [Syntrophomonadaceae bacterium]|nr:M23 family metallopeptidase [Syntrophomonadaceae bacterium]
MQTRKALICCMVALLGLMSPLHQAAGYLAEDSFASCWKDEIKEETDASTYTVQPGDTLWSISRRHGVDLKELIAANGIQGDLIKPGEVLVLSQTQARTHCVARGETLWSLARRYQVSVEQLVAVNQIQDPGSLRDGQELIIASNVEQAQPVAGQRGRTFSWPLSGRITSSFGPRDGGFHHGLDIAGDMGEVIQAARSGWVDSVGWLSLYGKTVILDHGNGYKTLYAHASDYLVSQGDIVEKGQGIAKVGSTGRSTGPHLHFEVRVNNKAVDPILYLEQKE